MKFAAHVVLGNALLVGIGVSAGVVVVAALTWAVVAGEIHELFRTPQDKEKD